MVRSPSSHSLPKPPRVMACEKITIRHIASRRKFRLLCLGEKASPMASRRGEPLLAADSEMASLVNRSSHVRLLTVDLQIPVEGLATDTGVARIASKTGWNPVFPSPNVSTVPPALPLPSDLSNRWTASLMRSDPTRSRFGSTRPNPGQKGVCTCPAGLPRRNCDQWPPYFIERSSRRPRDGAVGSAGGRSRDNRTVPRSGACLAALRELRQIGERKGAAPRPRAPQRKILNVVTDDTVQREIERIAALADQVERD